MYIGGTDERALHHLVAEVLDNSMDEAVAGHANRIEVELHADYAVTIRDHGRGIRACERKRLFRAFHKSAQEAAHSKPGVGLGLALCRRLARALGGDLTIDSNRDQGACFILQLP